MPPVPHAFDLLQETPRPHLDADALKAKFLRLSAPLHPDRVHHLSEGEKEEATRRFSELNAAYTLLREPRDRINLLLEFETGSKPKDIQRIPPGTMDLFVEVGQWCREFDAFLASRNPSESSPLLRLGQIRQQQEWQARLQAIQERIQIKAAETDAELRKLDAEWMASSDRKPLLDRLENAARLFSYLRRWNQQLGERQVQLQVATS